MDPKVEQNRALLHFYNVIPAQAGIQKGMDAGWMPAYAGMTELRKGNAKYGPHTL
jgi:hypothetical protein